MITHDNITWTAQQVINMLKWNHEEQVISYLPLSHIAEQDISLHAPYHTGCTVWFAESLDKLGENLVEIRPTVFFGVPRVWEKIQSKMMAAGAQNPPLKKKIAAWARKQGLAGGYAEQEGKPKPFLYGLADKLVFSKVREKLGFDRCRLFISTAAPISMNTLEFFLSLGLPLTEIYGMSECTGPGTVSLPEPFKYRTGWAGPAVPGTSIKIAEDGEVFMKGRHVFKGYFKNDAATAETIDKDGWLHSGDVGRMDNKGFLKITDRKKELIITTGGENIPPQVLEAELKSIAGVANVVVIGDQRQYMTAIFTLYPDKLDQELKNADSPAKNMAEAAKCPKFRAYIQQKLDEINAGFSRAQTIKKFTILPNEFSVEGNELTPTMKIKRRIINTKYAKEIKDMYK